MPTLFDTVHSLSNSRHPIELGIVGSLWVIRSISDTVIQFKGASHQIKCVYIDLLTSADISKCCTETQPKTPKQKAMQVLKHGGYLGRNLERNQAMWGGQSSSGCAGWRL